MDPTSPQTSTILLVDDEANALRVLSAILQEAGYACVTAQSVDEAISRLEGETPIDVLVTDLRMPGRSGLDLFEHVQTHALKIPVVFLTAYGTVDSAVRAVKEGAFYYFIKPPDYTLFCEIIRRAAEHRRLTRHMAAVSRPAKGGGQALGMVGQSRGMREIFQLIQTVAESQATVLVQGESGTGKELIARAIHSQSPRHRGPFVGINCGALPPTLLESELFGHEKGAFTSAVGRRIGRFEMADKGTLFLDEIGEMDLSLQVKLLRVIQEREFERVGSSARIKVDFRLVAASNKDLKAEVEAGRFRPDLFYRINVIPMRIPPLRERLDDLPLLAFHFLERYAALNKKEVAGIDSAALSRMMSYAWPGNVRELENAIERGVVLCAGSTLTEKDIPPDIAGTDKAPAGGAEAREVKPLSLLEKETIIDALRRSYGNKSKAARMLGITRKVLYARLREYGME